MEARIYSVLALVKLVIVAHKKIKQSLTAKSCLSIPSKSVPQHKVRQNVLRRLTPKAFRNLGWEFYLAGVTTTNVLNAYLSSKFSSNFDQFARGYGRQSLIRDDERVYEEMIDED